MEAVEAVVQRKWWEAQNWMVHLQLGLLELKRFMMIKKVKVLSDLKTLKENINVRF